MPYLFRALLTMSAIGSLLILALFMLVNAIHWSTPLIRLVRREVSACELYLKTRILAITRYKRSTILAAVTSGLLVFGLAGCGVMLGTRYAPSDQVMNNSFFLPIKAEVISNLNPEAICADILSSAGYPDGELFLYTGTQTMLSNGRGFNYFHWEILLREREMDGDRYRYCQIGVDPAYETWEPSFFVLIEEERDPLTDAPLVPLQVFLEAMVALPDDVWALKDPDRPDREPDGWMIHSWDDYREFQFEDNIPTVYGKDGTQEGGQYLLVNVTPMYRDENFTQMSGGAGTYLLYAYGGQAKQNSDPGLFDVDQHSADSPNGRWRLETYGKNPDVYIGGVYACESVRLIDLQTDEVCWQMEGWPVVLFQWSPDSRYVAVNYQGRVRKEILVVDIANMSEITLPGPYELAALYPEHLSVNTDRPDPCFSTDGWNDSTLIRVNFTWRIAWEDIPGTTEYDDLVQGDYIYDVARREITALRWYDINDRDANYARQLLDVLMAVENHDVDYSGPKELYDQLLDMGFAALPELTAVLILPDFGLRGQVAAKAVRDILDKTVYDPDDVSWNQTYKTADAALALWNEAMNPHANP